MTKIESLPLNVVLQLAKKELMECCRTTEVSILGVGFDYDVCECDGPDECTLMVTADVTTDDEIYLESNGVHPWVLVWDENRCDFHTVQRWDQTAKTEQQNDGTN